MFSTETPTFLVKIHEKAQKHVSRRIFLGDQCCFLGSFILFCSSLQVLSSHMKTAFIDKNAAYHHQSQFLHMCEYLNRYRAPCVRLWDKRKQIPPGGLFHHLLSPSFSVVFFVWSRSLFPTHEIFVFSDISIERFRFKEKSPWATQTKEKYSNKSKTADILIFPFQNYLTA